MAMTSERERCEYEFAPGARCQKAAGHEKPYYHYHDYGQYGEYSDTLSTGSPHMVLAPAPDLPPREEWTGEERYSRMPEGAPFFHDDYPGKSTL